MPPVPLLTAPTAAGKSALALALGRQFGLEVIAADAFTVYRGLDIGTAKPTPAERAQVPHHLLDVVDVTEDYDVARYTRAAESAIADVLARGRVPLVVGGTGFYLSALVRGLPLTPPADPQMRAEVEADLAARGLDALLAEVAAANPAEAVRLERNPRRVVRALEVYRRTGRFPGEFGYRPPAFRYRMFAFTHPWPELEARVAARTRTMLAQGWPEEAAWLAQQVAPDQEPRPTVWQALGYREALAVHAGTLDPEAAARQITLATRQYAKRQLTWVRTQLGTSPVTPSQAAEALVAFLSGGGLSA
ncbi:MULTISPECIES: tRNA (adenosine(37)-N6)-dimethylallyltransferase MiaA [Deinococcus]|uniref:tRNA dimethylallyltransferase n=1 Tax=Deinococcus geothermalis (strain DSM 11300 / CIP 105573 / AG-3a) TaxID=319795 RepID=MIAA_DEIGD|nr:tRNA (adenosine(37)-N6)-dimethylallyltransferase MiaA [Deinococcus geothermalis]Q1J022.1 RecName: Full=tRNA dimethylallyltransferase; AltName: Full=Dimethylallyl diphosphate:tRNA dimethylallyltransferase; Short=DMAPP:tRNA dimethylallyltransferase; Short=DMATase; AltName: Full=Isopentenyl-diphosphate:tRNA isopentenyltransferase; Short=IPP transferase; Short=IPPT; Short=IPTase [Deinococcus geothermalis DSM 11300]ABF45162.1 tRNA delta(2)-isopentenylpyrophosphate transferase [Deinococcus geotherma